MSALPSILTVGDDPIVRADLTLILEDHGFAVCATARDGVEAVALARQHAPDLVLIDLNLPELDGVEATRQIMDERPVPVVALTGHSGGDVIERALDAGAVDHVTKPFAEAHLIGVLRGALATSAAATAAEIRVRLLIERMVREGKSEDAIGRAVDDALAA
jgi:CheY-like chemotaxis protein